MRRLLLSASVVAVCALSLWAADKPKDTPAAAMTRKSLQGKITAEFKDEHLKVVLDDFNMQLDAAGVPKIKWRYDVGVSMNQRLSVNVKNKTVAEALDQLLKGNALGYIVISDPKSKYNGYVMIKMGKERGYPAGQEPDKETPKEKPDTDKSTTKDKPPSKDKPEEDTDKTEAKAAAKLKLAKAILEDGKKDKARERLEEVIQEYPKTKAAVEARAILKKLQK